MTERLRVDVAIIGGGIAGCAAAVALREAGLTVAVLEKALCGAGASGVNFGGVRQQGRNLAELPLARRARPLWDRLNERLGEDVEFEASGHLKLARSDDEMAQLERHARDVAEHGLRLELLGATALRAELPWLGHDVVGASLCAEDGHANPRLVGPAFARLARRLGADVREHAAVLSATRGGDGFETRTADLEVRSRYLVNCAGVGAGRIAAASAKTCRCSRWSRTCSSPSRCRSSSAARSASAAAASTCARSRAATRSSAAAAAGAMPTRAFRGR